MTLVETIRAAYPHHFRDDTPPGGCTARIDDRGPNDPYWAFCEVTLTVCPDETMTLTLSFPPLNGAVRTVVDDHRGRVMSHPLPTIVLDLPATDDAAAAGRALDTYCRGLLSDLPRKSVEPIALAAGTAVRTLQEFLVTARWDHAAKLTWHGFIGMEGDRMTRLVLSAAGKEKLKFQSARGKVEIEVAILPGGHRIDMNCEVRFGIIGEVATPAEKKEKR